MRRAQSASTAALLQSALDHHRQQRFDQAQELYLRVLADVPRHFDALHLLGVVARQQGRPQAAIELISRALDVDPAQAGAHCNLGAALQDVGRVSDALACFDQAIALKPRYALALCNRGNALRKLDRLEDAVASYERALEIDPAYPEAHCHRAIVLQQCNYPTEALAGARRALASRPRYAEALCVCGDALQSLQRLEEAVGCYDSAIELQPDWPLTHCSRGTALQRMQQFEQALASYERAIALQPHYPLAHQYRGNSLRALMRPGEAIQAYQLALAQGGNEDQIRYALASLGVGPVPAAAPADYVKHLFDGYASQFDQHLVEVLGYQTPALIDAMIGRATTSTSLDTLDIGCGTGLCGPYLRPRSRSLCGVDLSPNMLAKAQQRGLYDRLECGDLLAFLASAPQRFDLVVAADVFVYIGALAGVFAATHAALRAGGHFCFSVEDCEGAAYTLQPSNRFAHSLQYVQQAAADAGFVVVEAESAVVRRENQKDVRAHAVMLRRPSAL